MGFCIDLLTTLVALTFMLLPTIKGLILLSNNEIENEKSPILVVVMGVSGCGKTTLADTIANLLDMTFLDADSFHSEDAIKNMSQGIALTDQQRTPWIARICKQLNHLELQNKRKKKTMNEQEIKRLNKVVDMLEQRIAKLEKVLASHAKCIGEIRENKNERTKILSRSGLPYLLYAGQAQRN